MKKKVTEEKYLVIHGYTRHELSKVLNNFKAALPEFVNLHFTTQGLVTTISLSGYHESVEPLRFKLGQLRQNLIDMFHEEVITTENKTVAQILGQLLHERELTISCAESCTGGNIAHRIVQVPGSSSYFQGSVVSYSNDVKVNVLGVKRTDLEKNGAVSRQVVQQMVEGVCRIMRTDCGIATSGISGPDGGSLFKPVGTVWLAVKCLDKVVTECVHFNGNRDEVIESATNHGMIMLINMLRNSYMIQEDFNDE
jgi:nicotinamide-nucleotide amidase